ncbi:MAG: hypothetical protein ACAI44_40350 [Candidatus Sericytochromatia bacterium]
MKIPFRLDGNRPLLLAVLGLIVTVTAVGAWNERHRPKASFTLSSQDLSSDPLAPAAGTPDSEADMVPPAAADPAAAALPSVPTHGQIVGRDVNIRKQPSRQAQVVVRPQADAVYRLSGARRQAEGLEWIGLVMSDGSEAWVSSRFIRPVLPDRQAAAGADTRQPPAPEGAPGVDSGDEVETAAQVVSQLLLAPGKIWPQADPALRRLTVHALLQKIFKANPAAITPAHPPALDQCMQASSREKKLEALKVYELAAACALALNWRE